jgi:hypothetical protein
VRNFCFATISGARAGFEINTCNLERPLARKIWLKYGCESENFLQNLMIPPMAFVWVS